MDFRHKEERDARNQEIDAYHRARDEAIVALTRVGDHRRRTASRALDCVEDVVVKLHALLASGWSPPDLARSPIDDDPED